MSKQRIEDELESFIDNAGLENVVNSLAQICYEKSEHILETWDDAQLARRWRQAGDKLSKVQLPRLH